MYSSALIFLWITVIVAWIDFWRFSRSAFVVDNMSPITIFNKFQETSFIFLTANIMTIVISDAILVRAALYIQPSN